ncbi:MAG TPA: DNA translocase FtsK 4TM domain-containing protein, partial [Chitinophagaceae bacterium]|nr:DNA translocase FtsK 4TM domain-containing protein [Chitinophagaceae bacterium]
KSKMGKPGKAGKREKKGNPAALKSDKPAELSFSRLIRDERTHKVAGVLCLLAAVYLFIAFTSYLFTWQHDQVMVLNRSFRELFSPNPSASLPNVDIENMLGRLGAFISHLCFYRGIGLASYLFCYLFFILGMNALVGRKVFNIWRNVRYAIFGIVFLSTMLSFLLRHTGFPAGGAMGNLTSDYLKGLLGTLGTTLLLAVTALAFLIWKFNFEFRIPRRTAIPVQEDLEQGTMPPKAAARNFLDGFPGEPMVSLEIPLPQEALEMHLVEKETMGDYKIPAPVATPMHTNSNGKVDLLPLEVKPPMEARMVDAEEISEKKVAQTGMQDPYEPTLDLKGYQYPSLDLLENHGSDKIVQDNEELENNKVQIINTLKNYDITIQKISATVGPTVTLYEIVPAAGVRISRIKNLEDDIALSLSALGIRIIAPIPGKGTIGIEVPNVRKTIVSMRTLLSSEKFQHSKMNLPIAIGKKIDNENFIVDLTTMPHLLMAGATGQGKSVGINAVLVSLLYRKHPSQLKLVLVDPKKVELSLYKKIEKHFLAKLPGEEDAIITDTKKVIYTLNALCIEMDIRYDLLKEAGTRNIREYNEKFIHHKLSAEKGHRYLPFIVLVIDEFADLIMTAGKEIEMPLARLAQLARAVGIHLIIATQRPSVNIITGTIKANFPARIAFKVSSKVDSRTIIDTGGAEQLIGKGDMLIAYNGELVRLQCAYVDTQEAENVVNFIGNQPGYPESYLLPEYLDEKDLEGKEFSLGEKDPLFGEAARVIVQTQQGSTSLLQRRLKLGYNRAGRLMDQLESAGIVGPNIGSKVREVLVRSESELEGYLHGI